MISLVRHWCFRAELQYASTIVWFLRCDLSEDFSRFLQVWVGWRKLKRRCWASSSFTLIQKLYAPCHTSHPETKVKRPEPMRWHTRPKPWTWVANGCNKLHSSLNFENDEVVGSDGSANSECDITFWNSGSEALEQSSSDLRSVAPKHPVVLLQARCHVAMKKSARSLFQSFQYPSCSGCCRSFNGSLKNTLPLLITALFLDKDIWWYWSQMVLMFRGSRRCLSGWPEELDLGCRESTRMDAGQKLSRGGVSRCLENQKRHWKVIKRPKYEDFHGFPMLFPSLPWFLTWNKRSEDSPRQPKARPPSRSEQICTTSKADWRTWKENRAEPPSQEEMMNRRVIITAYQYIYKPQTKSSNASYFGGLQEMWQRPWESTSNQWIWCHSTIWQSTVWRSAWSTESYTLAPWNYWKSRQSTWERSQRLETPSLRQIHDSRGIIKLYWIALCQSLHDYCRFI